MTTIDYIGFDIHKKTISFCAKAQDGHILNDGTIAAQRGDQKAWAKERPRPWVDAMEATLFTGWIDETKPKPNQKIGWKFRGCGVYCHDLKELKPSRNTNII